jgi:hypothetical protein
MRATNVEQLFVGKCRVFNETVLVHHEHHVGGGRDQVGDDIGIQVTQKTLSISKSPGRLLRCCLKTGVHRVCF